MKIFISATFIVMYLLGQSVQAQLFSVDAGHTDTFGGIIPADDILAPGFPPALVLPGAGTVDVDAFSMGHFGPITPLHPTFIPRFDFSVDAIAVGGAGSAVASEASFFDAETDVFRSSGFGTNTLLFDGDAATFGLGIAEGAGAPGPTIEGLDGYDRRPPGFFAGPIFWSVDVGSLIGPYAGASGADIFASPPVGGFSGAGLSALWATSTSLGLIAGDEIDALEIFDGGALGVFDAPDVVLFSLAPSSPSIGLLGVAPGDVLISGFGGFGGIYAPGTSLGLSPVDNLNALSITGVPEPGGLFALALLGCVAVCRRKKQKLI